MTLVQWGIDEGWVQSMSALFPGILHSPAFCSYLLPVQQSSASSTHAPHPPPPALVLAQGTPFSHATAAARVQCQCQPKLCGSTLQVLSLTMGAPRWPTRAGLGGSWFSSMMQGEVIPRGARYSAIITALYTSSRNTLRPAGTDRRWSEVHREHSGGC